MLIRLSYLLLIVSAAIAAFLLVRYSRQDDESPAAFSGADRCATCHSSIPAGRQYGIWKESAHARASETLESDSARAFIARNPDSAQTCIGCHSTLGRAAVAEGEAAINQEGVGCERCHGPGSRYSYYDTMRDRARFTADGGVVGSLRDCYGCHAADPASGDRHCPFQTRPFIADSAWQRIRHPMPAQTPKPDTVTDLRQR